MTQFSRAAPWLRSLFIESSSPTVKNPATRSDDVSLVQPYDGGGWPLAGRDSSAWAVTFTTNVGVTGVNTDFTLLKNEIMRILAIGIVTASGAIANSQVRVQIAGVGTVISISDDKKSHLTEEQPLVPIAPLVGPESRLIFRHYAGSAATSIKFNLLVVRVPIGTVFYI